MAILVGCVCLLDIGTSAFFYVGRDLTTLAQFDLLLFCAIGLVAKPFFWDTPMQWLFSYVAAINMYCATVVVSYLLSRFLPSPAWGNIFIRIVLFASLIVLFRKYLRPLYRQVVERWSVFLLLTVAVLLNFIYYVAGSSDIERTLVENAPALMLIVVVMVMVYFTIFASLSSLLKESALRAENAAMHAQRTLLDSELTAARDYVRLARQNRHDMRHHDAIVLEYLSQGEIAEAREYLEQHEQCLRSQAARDLCENQTANAVFLLYEQRCLDEGIDISFRVALPASVHVSNVMLGALFSNLLENAWKTCRSERASGRTAGMVVASEIDGCNRLVIDVRNSATEPVSFEGGMPLRADGKRGLGTQSVADIVDQCKGMVRFSQKEGTFAVQIVIAPTDEGDPGT